tara:strand:- start:262 stop:483 length:222 start_codon:yes stop_codon:yes gene_type:complete
MAKSRKLTYRELLDQLDQRDAKIVEQLKHHSMWISTVEKMLDVFLKWFLSKRKYQKFIDHTIEQQKEKKDGTV